jgi:TP901 family phage tail tape measure protein
MATKNLNATITIGGAISGALKSALGTTRQQLQGIGGSVRELTTRQQRLGAAATHWERMGRDASRFHSELRRVNSELERQRRMQASLRAQDANTARRGELRGQLFDAVALGATLAAPVRVAMEFEQSMARVGAVARASGEELTRLTATARQLGATTNWTASQVAEGMQFLAMAGFNTEQTIAAMPGMLSLASAGAIDLGAAADIASNILTGFNMRAEEMGRLGDVMTNTFTTSNTNLQMLGESMKYVAPVAAATGVSLEQTAAMVGKLGDAGIQGSMAGTALRAIINRLAAPSGQAAKALEQLGVTTTDAAGNLRQVPDILADMSRAMEGMGTAAKAELTSTIFGLEAASAATVLLGQAGSGSLQEYTERLREAGSAARVASQQNDTATGAMKRLGSAMESISITVGNVLLPPLAFLAEKVAVVIGVVDSLAAEFPLLTSVVVGGTAALIGLKVAAIAGGYAFTFLKGAWLSASLMGLKLGGALPVIAGGIKAIGLAMAANPIGLVLTGIAVAAGLVIANWEPIKGFMLNLWETITTGASVAWEWLKGILSFTPLGLVVTSWEPIRGFFTELFDNIRATATAAIDWVLGKINAVGETWGKVKSFFGFGGDKAASAAAPGQPGAPGVPGAPGAAAPLPAPAMATAMGASPVVNAPQTNTFHITQQPGQDSRQLADEVARRLAERDAVRRRGAMFDPAMGY